MTYFDDVWQRTVTVVEREKEPTPLLYRPDGTPLAPEAPRVGFTPPTAPPNPRGRSDRPLPRISPQGAQAARRHSRFRAGCHRISQRGGRLRELSGMPVRDTIPTDQAPHGMAQNPRVREAPERPPLPSPSRRLPSPSHPMIFFVLCCQRESFSPRRRSRDGVWHGWASDPLPLSLRSSPPLPARSLTHRPPSPPVPVPSPY